MTTKLFTALFAAALVLSPVPDTYIPADDDVTALAQMAYGEARGLADYEIAACMWVALNRLDHGGYGDTVEAVVSAPGQFAGYSAQNPVDEELAAIARDVLILEGPWDEEFQRNYCAGCGKVSCDDGSPCPYEDKRNSPGWWLGLEAVAAEAV